jgi:hypothetical protein
MGFWIKFSPWSRISLMLRKSSVYPLANSTLMLILSEDLVLECAGIKLPGKNTDTCILLIGAECMPGEIADIDAFF